MDRSTKRRKSSSQKPKAKALADGKEDSNSGRDAPFSVYYIKPRKTSQEERDEPLPSTEQAPDLSDLEVPHEVRPQSQWDGMRSYRSFVVGEETFKRHDFVFINNSDVEYGASLTNVTLKRKFWVALVVEVRAIDGQNVFVRVLWVYWPDELPGGREKHHGKYELVPSSHMDVINATTVSGRANVSYWSEDDDLFEDLFWRQTLSFQTKKLSPLREHCLCKQAYNPDNKLLGCSNASCHIWLHEECLIEDALSNVFSRMSLSPIDDKAANPAKRKSSGSSVSKSKPWKGRLEGEITHAVDGPWMMVKDLSDRSGKGALLQADRVACLVCGKEIT